MQSCFCQIDKTDNFGSVVGNCGRVNSKEQMKRMRDDLRLAASVAEIQRKKNINADAKQDDFEQKLLSDAPAAIKTFLDKTKI